MTEKERRKRVEARYDYENEHMTVLRANEDMPCKDCKYAGRDYYGKKTNSYTCYNCEKYKMKPDGVYFEAKDCPSFKEKL